MTNFLDGPAKGAVLCLRTTLELLRVTMKPRTEGSRVSIEKRPFEFDALNLPQDMPGPGEVMYVYFLVAKKGTVHMRPGGFFPIADYRLYETQPSQEVMASPMDWGEWKRAEYEKLNAKTFNKETV